MYSTFSGTSSSFGSLYSPVRTLYTPGRTHRTPQRHEEKVQIEQIIRRKDAAHTYVTPPRPNPLLSQTTPVSSQPTGILTALALTPDPHGTRSLMLDSLQQNVLSREGQEPLRTPLSKQGPLNQSIENHSKHQFSPLRSNLRGANPIPNPSHPLRLAPHKPFHLSLNLSLMTQQLRQQNLFGVYKVIRNVVFTAHLLLVPSRQQSHAIYHIKTQIPNKFHISQRKLNTLLVVKMLFGLLFILQRSPIPLKAKISRIAPNQT
ncbi:hypothetical protein BLNAU_15060 [Blattamonas nauphoetae]|uniref:Uncharacterized protein n=1 Tax=Blattamonas nauphoetae TaxID=2049346 RepID=A0ABQ9XFM4_9EUKA|nr:hypothetical protein BLNAU_15060 [Blattamonas nauphoetae]